MTEQQTKTLRLERTFDATPQEVWAAWTDPQQYAKWFNPAGIDLVVHEFDVRPGGRVRFDMPQPDGNPNPQDGVFHVVSPHSRLVSGSPDKSFLVDVNIRPRGASRSDVVVEITGVPPEFHEMATAGWGTIFERLELRFAEATAVAGQTLQIERTFDATPEAVWEALTTREVYAKWISPFPGLDAEVHEFDPRPGGRTRFTMIAPNGDRFPEASFLYEKVERPREIVQFEANRDRPDVFNGHPMRSRIELLPVESGRTRLVMEIAGLPKDFPVDAAKQGFGSCLEKLAKVLG